jgi:hypothetical protein
VERNGSVLKSYLNGELVGTATTDRMPFRHRIGLYTVSSTAQFDDVKIYVAKPVKPLPEDRKSVV